MGGAERVATFLANSWIGRGYEIIVMPTFSGGGSGSFYELDERVRLVYLKDLEKKSNSYFHRIRALRGFIIKHEIEYVISFITNVNIIALLSSIGLKKKVVICERSDPIAIRLPFLWRVVRNLAYPLASAVLVQTSEVYKKLICSYSCTYKSKLDFIANPLSGSFPIVQNIEEPAVKAKKIMAVGRLSKEKQFHHLIEAFNLAQPHGWVVEIYGDGPERSNLEELIKSKNLENRVVLKGVCTDLCPIYRQSSVFCMTSLYEGFPNALLEAMSQGCAILSYKTPSGPCEMLKDGANGLLIELNDIRGLAQGISYITSNRERRIIWGRNAIRMVQENYSEEVILDRWEQLFLQLSNES